MVSKRNAVATEETALDYKKRVKWRYDRSTMDDHEVNGTTVISPSARRYPPKPPRILVHNFAAPENAERIHGDGGFRVWTQLPDKEMTPCSCGWRPDLGLHYTSHVMSKKRMAAIRAKATHGKSVDAAS
jgi:hypothetical protein